MVRFKVKVKAKIKLTSRINQRYCDSLLTNQGGAKRSSVSSSIIVHLSNRDLIEPTGRREGSISLIAIRALLEPPNRSTVRLIETTLLELY